MTSFFDFAATGLFIATAGLFFYRLQFEDPSLKSYLTAAAAAAFGNWAGDNGAALPAILILVATGFLLVHLASAPFEE